MPHRPYHGCTSIVYYGTPHDVGIIIKKTFETYHNETGVSIGVLLTTHWKLQTDISDTDISSDKEKQHLKESISIPSPQHALPQVLDPPGAVSRRILGLYHEKLELSVQPSCARPSYRYIATVPFGNRLESEIVEYPSRLQQRRAQKIFYHLNQHNSQWPLQTSQ